MAMVGALTRVNQDILPYTLVEGNPAVTRGLNVVGLRRNGVNAEVRSELKKAYKILCRKGLTVERAIAKIAKEVADAKEVIHLVNFAKETKRGIIK